MNLSEQKSSAKSLIQLRHIFRQPWDPQVEHGTDQAPSCLNRLRPRERESREQRAESREQRAESREQRAESREQRAESREQRAESREQRAVALYRSTTWALRGSEAKRRSSSRSETPQGWRILLMTSRLPLHQLWFRMAHYRERCNGGLQSSIVQFRGVDVFLQNEAVVII